jgi:formylglycine-generating enzyme required for sulfatase activity
MDEFCRWAGGRLPSEAEWEYAARSGGLARVYPWGDETATCTYAVMSEGGHGCGTDRTWTVCSKEAGNTAQGLCDMAGNVWEWVQDWYHNTYTDAPIDGSAWEIPSGTIRVVRGGSFVNTAGTLRAANRNYYDPGYRHVGFGARCGRDAP